MKEKILFFLLANILAFTVILYIIDYFGVSDLYSRLKERLPWVQTENVLDVNVQTLNLIEAEEEKKLLESFSIRETELGDWEANLKEKEENLKAKELKLKQEKQNFKLQKEKLEEDKEKEEAYNLKINNLAQKFFNMPPEKSVERILALKNDLLILDVLKAMDKYTANTDRPSIVPYLFSLMPPEDSARLDKKYALK